MALTEGESVDDDERGILDAQRGHIVRRQIESGVVACQVVNSNPAQRLSMASNHLCTDVEGSSCPRDQKRLSDLLGLIVSKWVHGAEVCKLEARGLSEYALGGLLAGFALPFGLGGQTSQHQRLSLGLFPERLELCGQP